MIILCTSTGMSQEDKRKIHKTGVTIGYYLSTGYNRVFQPGGNGSGISMNYDQIQQSGWGYSVGTEYRINDWGNLILVETGFMKSMINRHKWELVAGMELLNGLALFHPHPHYVFGIEVLSRAQLYTRLRTEIRFELGLRWTACPAYKDYGLITSYLEIPLRIGMMRVW